MAVFIARRRWVRQPSSLLRPTSGSLAVGLKILINCNDGYECVTSTPPVVVNAAGLTNLDGRAGIEARGWNVGSGYFLRYLAPSYFGEPFSVFALVSYAQTTTGAICSFGGASAGKGWHVGTLGANKFDLTYGGVADYQSTYTVPVGISALGVSVPGSTARFFGNGAFVGSVSVGNPATPANAFTVGASYMGAGYTTPWPDGILMLAAWNRALADDEQEAIADNPW